MRWLVDEMLPPATADHLRDLGHDAISVESAGLLGAPDREIFALAVATGRSIVTENFGDFANLLDEMSSHGDACVPVVFVRKASLGGRGGLARRLAEHLHHWAEVNSEPYIGLHWP